MMSNEINQIRLTISYKLHFPHLFNIAFSHYRNAAIINFSSLISSLTVPLIFLPLLSSLMASFSPFPSKVYECENCGSVKFISTLHLCWWNCYRHPRLYDQKSLCPCSYPCFSIISQWTCECQPHAWRGGHGSFLGKWDITPALDRGVFHLLPLFLWWWWISV